MVKKTTFYAISRLNSWLKVLQILKTLIINIMEYKINKNFKNICEFTHCVHCAISP